MFLQNLSRQFLQELKARSMSKTALSFKKPYCFLNENSDLEMDPFRSWNNNCLESRFKVLLPLCTCSCTLCIHVIRNKCDVANYSPWFARWRQWTGHPGAKSAIADCLARHWTARKQRQFRPYLLQNSCTGVIIDDLEWPRIFLTVH